MISSPPGASAVNEAGSIQDRFPRAIVIGASRYDWKPFLANGRASSGRSPSPSASSRAACRTARTTGLWTMASAERASEVRDMIRDDGRPQAR